MNPNDFYTKHHVFICDCGEISHNLIVTEEKDVTDDKYPDIHELTVSVHMNVYLPFYKRIWEAIKYIFAIDNGKYDVVYLSKENRKRLKDILENFDATS